MIINAIILGIIEGLTEFLPVSSTGHLILVSKYINFTGEFANTFNVVIQIGAIFAVVIYFWKKIFPNFHDRYQSKKVISLWGKVIVGVIPAVVLGLKFNDYIDQYLMGNAKSVAAALIVGAILLLFAEKKLKWVRVDNTDEIGYVDAIVIGFAQCFAMWPGMSRSASTIIGGLFMGLSREAAAEFSFFLAIPTLFGASLLKVYKLLQAGFAFTSPELMALAVGTGVSFIVAYIVVAAFMSYIKKRKLAPFAYYRIILGIAVLILLR